MNEKTDAIDLLTRRIKEKEITVYGLQKEVEGLNKDLKDKQAEMKNLAE